MKFVYSHLHFSFKEGGQSQKVESRVEFFVTDSGQKTQRKIWIKYVSTYIHQKLKMF